MVLEKYKPHFASLAIDEAVYLAEAMHLPEVHALDGEAIFDVANEAGMDQADVVMTLAHDVSVEGVKVVEKLIGKPIERKPRPIARGAGASVRGRASVPRSNVLFDRDSVIEQVAENPKKQGSASYARFALYKPGMTVAQFLLAGGTMGDVKWDSERGFITFKKDGETGDDQG